MLRVKTKLGKSKIHGIGLFADQFIPKGTVTWKYHPKFDKSFDKKEIAKMSEVARKQLFHYAYYNKKLKEYVLCFDDQRFINHSSKPQKINIYTTPDTDVAACNIKVGEELLCDYNKFDDTYFKRLNIRKNKLN